jgi:hypothetical protein
VLPARRLDAAPKLLVGMLNYTGETGEHMFFVVGLEVGTSASAGTGVRVQPVGNPPATRRHQAIESGHDAN